MKYLTDLSPSFTTVPCPTPNTPHQTLFLELITEWCKVMEWPSLGKMICYRKLSFVTPVAVKQRSDTLK